MTPPLQRGGPSLSGFCSTEATVQAGRAGSSSPPAAWHARCRAPGCPCPGHDAETEAAPAVEEPEGEPTMPNSPKPTLTKNRIAKGNAPRQAAKQKAHVAESSDKLDALKERQAQDDADAATVAKTQLIVAPEDAEALSETVDAAALEAPPADAPASSSSAPSVQFVVDGKPVGATQNNLSNLAGKTATKDERRWPSTKFREWLAEQGITDPNHTTWEVTLPTNGRKVGAVAREGSTAPAALAKKAAPAKRAARTRKAS